MQAQDPAPTGNGWLKQVPVLVILAVALAGAVFFRDQLSFETLARHRETLIAFRDAHYLVTVAGFIAAYIAIVALSLPGGTVATLTGGFLFGLFPGVIFNVIGASGGAILIFLAVRHGFGDRLAQRVASGGGKAARLMAALRENEWSVLFLMRLVPLVPFVLSNLIPALVGTSLWRFAVSTCLGIIPGALVFTSVGSGLGEVFARGETPDLGIIFTPPILLPLLGLATLAALPMVLKALRKRDFE
ncbi:MAG: VTT domain-containing protein [Rhodobacterales bacterium]|nr:VTT domain-containing protein [Rhodobacterales bacterium]